MGKVIIGVLVVSLALVGGLYVHNLANQSIYYYMHVEDINENWLHLDLYFATHHLYTSLFMDFELFHLLSLQQKYDIIHSFIYNLSTDSTATLIISNFDGKKDLIIGIDVLKTNNKYSLFLVSNYNAVTKKIIDIEKNFANAHFLFLDIIDNKLLTRNDHYSEERIESTKAKGNNHNLAKYYLFDEIAENDQYIEELLFDYIHQVEDVQLKFFSILTLAQYYTSIGTEEDAVFALGIAYNILMENKDLENREYMIMHFMATYEVLEITNQLRIN